MTTETVIRRLETASAFFAPLAELQLWRQASLVCLPWSPDLLVAHVERQTHNTGSR